VLRPWLKRLTSRFRPAIDAITGNERLKRYFPAITDPDLWYLNRKSAARAVAIGLFCGLIPGPLQALGSIGGCLVFRAHLPLAVATTFYTNPFTIVPLYVAAYEIGRLFFPDAATPHALAFPDSAGVVGWFPAFAQWVAGLGKPLAVGLVLLASILAVTGFVGMRLAWRWHAVRAWRKRCATRAATAQS